MTLKIPKVSAPTLLINTQQCSENIRVMAEKAKRNQLVFRPHFKTHQSEVIANLFRNEGIFCITVSSFRMAEEFALQGWHDITVAFPVNILEIALLNKLTSKITLNLTVESEEVVDFLNHHLKQVVSVWIKIDTGYHRTGIPSTDDKAISKLIETISKSRFINFLGFLVHSGHSYQADGKNELELIHQQTLTQLQQLKSKYSSLFPNLKVSIGDTPTCSTMDSFEGVDEIRPGNFVFYDAAQLFIGSCQLSQIAAFMACPVVAKHAERSELVLYGGAVHFSKDSFQHPTFGTCYGLMVEFTKQGFELIPGCYVKSLSQEHGILVVTKEFLKEKNPGDIVYVIPSHSCLTANLMKNDTRFI